ncbi:MAG: hypothetical protein A3H96_12355 [Acidobacteria bacterium RIFCSPLOWO2_02_FULL_67_36]|nr:MAG: hypothetical protein A3H96_12355 [Acidobacteria bacterium RIFCSPLOWO2_02_FULL_67_36]OFW22619.1 MAG: hypothetical protein A3G21_24710 [Acidobacteria bacterium RIFCSPLOWO2_12_FULL_66_21]
MPLMRVFGGKSNGSSSPVFQPAIGLGQHRQNDVALVHRPLTLVTEYSGSSSPYARARFAADRFNQSSRFGSVAGGSTVTIKRVFGGKSNGSSSRIVLPS